MHPILVIFTLHVLFLEYILPQRGQSTISMSPWVRSTCSTQELVKSYFEGERPSHYDGYYSSGSDMW